MAEGGDMPSVKDLIEQFRQGNFTFPELVRELASHDYSDPTVADEASRDNSTAAIYDRGETEPDDNSFFWVEAAVDDDTLSPEEVELIEHAIDQEYVANHGSGQ